jgi:hypothetical protein
MGGFEFVRGRGVGVWEVLTEFSVAFSGLPFCDNSCQFHTDSTHTQTHTYMQIDKLIYHITNTCKINLFLYLTKQQALKTSCA